MANETEKLRIDKYLWSIRIFKTRSIASEACAKGRVKLNGVAVKASKIVQLNDEYEVKTEARKWIIQVTQLLYNRVQYSEAVKYYNDLTPVEDKEIPTFKPSSFHTGKRLSKIGRPTKQQRRDIDQFLSDNDEHRPTE